MSPPTPKKDVLPPLNNNVDCFNPNFVTCSTVLQSRMSVADCHTPPLSTSPPLSCQLEPVKACGGLQLPSKLTSNSGPASYSCQTPVSILSHFEDSSKPPVDGSQGFPPQPQYISL